MRVISASAMRPWLVGVVLSGAGMFLGLAAGSETARLLGGEPGIWARLGKGLTWGAVITALQWPAVRTAGVPLVRFLAAGAGGLAVGYPLGHTVQGILASHWGMHWTGYAAALAMFGLCLGVPQWWVFRRRVQHAGLWIVCSIVAWLLSGVALIGFGVGVFNAGLYGVAAGLGLGWLVHSRRTDSGSGGEPAAGR